MRLKVMSIIILIAVLAGGSTAHAFRFGIGGFAGANMPIGQEDARMGPAFGIKVRIPLVPFVGIEPHFIYLKNGEAEIGIKHDYWNDTPQKTDGGKYTTFGVNLVFGSITGNAGLNFYGVFGVSAATFNKHDGAIPNLSRASYWTGLGVEYGINDAFTVDFHAKFLFFPYKGDSKTVSRKNGIVTIGVNYYIGEGDEL